MMLQLRRFTAPSLFGPEVTLDPDDIVALEEAYDSVHGVTRALPPSAWRHNGSGG